MRNFQKEFGLGLITVIVLLNGCAALLEGLFVRFPGNINTLLPVHYWYYHRPIHILLGFFLIYFSFKLYERKYIAWIITVISTAVITISNLIHGIGGVPTLLSFITFVLLLKFAFLFRVRGDRESIKQGIILTITSIGISIVYGTLGFWLLDKKDFGIDFQLLDSFVRVLKEYVLIGNDDLVPHTLHARWFITSLDTIGFMSIGFGFYSLFKPLTYRFTTLPHEKEKALSLIKQYSQTTEDFFKLWPEDKLYFFSSSGKGVIAYSVTKDVAVVHGDPVGEEKSIEELISSFASFCYEQGWVCMFLHASPAFLSLYKQYGFTAIKIGEDALVHLPTFVEKTMKDKYFRNISNRFPRLGFHVRVYNPPHTTTLLRKLSEVSKDWLSQKGKQERGFAMGYFNFSYLQNSRIYTVEDSRGIILAFINEVPFYLPERTTIDLIRYRADIPSGALDFLLSQMMLELHKRSVLYFDLGLAPFSGEYELASTTPFQLLVKMLYESNLPLPFKGLRLFKQKYDPHWEPRFMIFRQGPGNFIKTTFSVNDVMKKPHKKK